jgi:hypothetical protein
VLVSIVFAVAWTIRQMARRSLSRS